MKSKYFLILWVVFFNSCATSYMTQQFKLQNSPKAPDYYSEHSWAELPTVASELKSIHLPDSLKPLAVDVFYVKDMIGLKITAENKQQSIREKLQQAIELGAEASMA